jgi:ATP-dependent protease La (LON) domain.
MASLQNRINQVQERENKIPLVVLDCMLPRQTLKVQVNNDLFLQLVRNQMEKENPTFGMLGMAILSTGEKIHLKTGVEVEIVTRPRLLVSDKGDGAGAGADGMAKNGKSESGSNGVLLELKAGRRFVITGEVENASQGWTEARVDYLDSRQQEEEEISNGPDKMAVARAIMRARELTVPNGNMQGNVSLVDRWIELARQNEREVGQIDELLEDLGGIPPEDEPSERALWVGALINPLPAMGVAMEIRPALLTATTAERRVDIACDAILKSIRHMEGTKNMLRTVLLVTKLRYLHSMYMLRNLLALMALLS